eukprot:1784689-Pleurochrysis_carterae.AAC.1
MLACTVNEFAGLKERLVQLMLSYGAFIWTTCTTVYCGAREALSEHRRFCLSFCFCQFCAITVLEYQNEVEKMHLCEYLLVDASRQLRRHYGGGLSTDDSCTLTLTDCA